VYSKEKQVRKIQETRNGLRATIAAALLVAGTAWAGTALAESVAATSAARAAAGMPEYKVDPSWPKQLPNNWLIGQVGGVAVDKQNNVWVLQRPRTLTVDEAGAVQVPPRSDCCVPAPAVLEFTQNGDLINWWGGPGTGYDWPASEHGIWVDEQNNVWVGGNSATDRQILKFTQSGRFLMQIGHPSSDPIDSTRTDILGQVAQIHVDDQAHEVYLADGYGNHRVIVYDSDTGAFKRMWGAYGKPPTDVALGAYDPAAPPATQFRNPVHCARISVDNLVYVCDRVNDRIQVFTKSGTFVKEFFVRTQTLGNGSVWDLTFSQDRRQKYLVIIDGENNVVWTLDRNTGALVDQQFHNGRNAGQFHWVHQFASDSNGNIYTGEVDTSKRIQKFVLQPK
jgi:DNA-binding beta-propeller fold protein YncE